MEAEEAEGSEPFMKEKEEVDRWEWWFEGWGKKAGVSPEAWERWKADKVFHCVFCRWHGTEEDFPTVLGVLKGLVVKVIDGDRRIPMCPSCKEYRGIEPCLKDCEMKGVGGGRRRLKR